MNVYEKKYKFIIASTDDEFKSAKELFIEYSKSLNFSLRFQKFENELIDIETMYNCPLGGIVLCKETESNEFIGCVGVRKFDNDIAELKRMYLREPYRNKGFGEKLLEMAIDLAKDLHYSKIRLDTIKTMIPAIKLYRKKGFYQIESYRFNPDKDALFFELLLK